MMLSVGVSELRAHLTHFLQKAKEGEVIVVTSRGVEIARLVPPHFAMAAAREKLEQLRQTAVVGDVLSPIGDDWEAEG
ncbi:MAG: type II toxin-antitoxin system prevent-host-death family antitoxin [Chloroflexi bacterium]|nr:MAG: type II toxin-antitoxin system prevent-host-death family antitoxin [Chloroflexota bacterium]